MAFSFVRTTQLNVVGASVVSMPLSAAAVANNFLVIHTKHTNVNGFVSLVDNVGNTYAVAGGPVDNGVNARIYQYYGVQVIGGATTLTLTISGTDNTRVIIDEFSGGALTNAALFDQVASNTGTGTSSSVSLSPTQAGCLIIGGIGHAAAIVTPAAGSGFTLSSSSAAQIGEYKLSGTTSETVAASWTNSAAWASLAASYKPLAAATNGAGFFGLM